MDRTILEKPKKFSDHFHFTEFTTLLLWVFCPSLGQIVDEIFGQVLDEMFGQVFDQGLRPLKL